MPGSAGARTPTTVPGQTVGPLLRRGPGRPQRLPPGQAEAGERVGRGQRLQVGRGQRLAGRWRQPRGPGRACRGTARPRSRSAWIRSARSSPMVRTSLTGRAGPPARRCPTATGGTPGPLRGPAGLHRRLEGRLGVAGVDVGPADPHAVPAGVVGQRLGRVEPHRLGVDQRGAEGGRVVALEPGAGEDQGGEAHRVALREAVVGEGGQLQEQVVGELRR